MLKYIDEHIVAQMYGTGLPEKAATTNQSEQNSNQLSERAPNETELKLSAEADMPIYIKGRPVHFTSVHLLDTLECLMPDFFNEMPIEEVRIKYPSEQRPHLVYSEPDGVVDVTISYTDMEIKDHELEAITKQLSAVIRRVQPIRSWQGISVIPTDHMTLATMKFVVSVVDGDIYNEMLLLHNRGQLVIVTFHCDAEEIEDWRPMTDVLIRSLRLSTKEENTYESGLS